MSVGGFGNSGNGIVTDGLIFSVDAYNQKSYVSGDTTTNDLTSNGNNGTLVNGVGFDDKTWTFDGVNDHINFGDVDVLNSSPITVEFWMNPTSYGGIGFGRIISKVSVQFPSNGFDVFLNGGSNKSMGVKINGVNNLADNNLIFLDELVHIVVTHESGVGTTFYKNGEFVQTVTTTTSSIISNSEPLTIGDWGAQNGARAFEGDISLCKTYNRLLSSEEIKQNYNALKWRFR